jgi:hypothetical protein
LSHLSVVPTLTLLWMQVGMETTCGHNCHLYCDCGHTWLTGLLVNFACTRLSWVEEDTVLSRHLPLGLFHQESSSVISDLLSSITFNLIYVQAYVFYNSYNKMARPMLLVLLVRSSKNTLNSMKWNSWQSLHASSLNKHQFLSPISGPSYDKSSFSVLRSLNRRDALIPC